MPELDYTPTEVFTHLHPVKVTVPKRSFDGAVNMKLDAEARAYFRRQVADEVHKALLANPDLIEALVKA